MPRNSARRSTLWGGAADAAVMAYTVGDDRDWDARLLRWDILGSLGHAEGLRRSGIISATAHQRMQRLLRAALRAADRGRLGIGDHEDVHSAVEFWLARRDRRAGGMVHTGRSRNDQVAVDLRLYLKDRVLSLQARATELAAVLLDFSAAHQRVIWPGYTHQRRAMPSSAGLWAAAYAEGLLDTIESLDGLWPRIDRSPLGSAAGYGVPLPLNREATARALGFRGIDQSVTAVQNGRGKLEAAVLYWCSELGHEMAKLSTDVILFSAEEFGWLRLPADLATGSSIMPQKRNPDLFELTRGRAALVEGALGTVQALKAHLPGGYHRDFQLIKGPLMQGIGHTGEMLAMLALAIPRLEVDAARGLAAVQGDILATDEAVHRTRGGLPFREAYLQVAAELKQGAPMPRRAASELLLARRSSGGLGNVGIASLRQRATAARRWWRTERRRFDDAMLRLSGRRT